LLIDGEPAKPRNQTFLLLNEAGEWKIEEILTADESEQSTVASPFYGTLHAYLHALRAKDCQ